MRSARLMFCGVLLACTSSTMILAQAHNAGPNPRPEEQVAQLERDWLAADGKGDTASLRRIISDDFVGSSFDGRVLSKRDVIPEETGPGGFAGATPGETNVRIFGYRRPDGRHQHRGWAATHTNPRGPGLPEKIAGLAVDRSPVDAGALTQDSSSAAAVEPRLHRGVSRNPCSWPLM